MNITKITSILDFDAHKFVGFVDEITNIIADKVVQRIQEEERKPKLYSVEDVCDILHISKATLWRYEKAGAGLRLLNKCDAIMLCGDWHHSKGCVIEQQFARGAGLEVYFEESLKID